MWFGTERVATRRIDFASPKDKVSVQHRGSLALANLPGPEDGWSKLACEAPSLLYTRPAMGKPWESCLRKTGVTQFRGVRRGAQRACNVRHSSLLATRSCSSYINLGLGRAGARTGRLSRHALRAERGLMRSGLSAGGALVKNDAPPEPAMAAPPLQRVHVVQAQACVQQWALVLTQVLLRVDMCCGFVWTQRSAHIC